jgi:hypothetical protein
MHIITYAAAVLSAAATIWGLVVRPLKNIHSNIATKDHIEHVTDAIAEIKATTIDLVAVQNGVLREQLTRILRDYIHAGEVIDDDLYDAVGQMYEAYSSQRGLNGRVERLWLEVQKLPFREKEL